MKSGVLFQKSAKVLAHHVILPNPLVDGKESRIDRERDGEQDHGQFDVHSGILLYDNRSPDKKQSFGTGEGKGSPPPVVRAL